MLAGRNMYSQNPESLMSINGAIAISDISLGLLAKKKYRAYREFTANTSVKLVFTKNFFLSTQKLWTSNGAARAVVSIGGTESGTYVALPTVFNLNQIGTLPTPNSALFVGGTHTGGTEREVVRSDSTSILGGTGSGDLLSARRLLPAGTYYVDIVVSGLTPSGIYSIEWEEQ